VKTSEGRQTPCRDPFAIFAAAGGAVTLALANNRIFVQFTDSSGAVRSSTSVTVETQ
jgi:hypothetical protein